MEGFRNNKPAVRPKFQLFGRGDEVTSIHPKLLLLMPICCCDISTSGKLLTKMNQNT
uniref:Uncharacterized protein n=1 Tax=Solanum tuberosum TaxID=4113 RepID=M1B2Q4_SOLTU